MMTAKEFVLGYMEAKGVLIQSITGIPADMYFNEQDREALLNQDYVTFEEIKTGLPDHFYCPFCVVWGDDCGECPYATRHGVCGETGSTLDTIAARLQDEEINFMAMSKQLYKERGEEYDV